MEYLLYITKQILKESQATGLRDPCVGVLRALSVFFRQGANPDYSHTTTRNGRTMGGKNLKSLAMISRAPCLK